MRNYLVMEIQTVWAGTTTTLVQSYSSREEAESRYYSILSAACVSTVMIHTAVFMTDNGVTIEAKSFSHAQTEQS